MKRETRRPDVVDAEVVEVNGQRIVVAAVPQDQLPAPPPAKTPGKTREALDQVPAVQDLPRWEDGDA